MNSAPLVPVLIVLFAAAAAAAMSARARARWRTRVLVVAANALMALGVWGLIWPPQVVGAAREAVLLTAGADAAHARQAAGAPLVVALAAGNASAPWPAGVQRVADLAALARAHPQVRRLRVVGDGADAGDWAHAGQWDLTLQRSAEAPRVHSARWPARVAPGVPLTVETRVRRAQGETLSAVLLDPFGGEVQRAPIVADSGVTSLRAPTMAVGRYLYRWQLRDENERVLRDEPVPVAVVAPPPLRLLVVLSAPSFESRYLLHWAGQGEVALASSIRISQERYRDAFVAQAPRRLRPIDDAVLGETDLLICDERTWRELAPAARAAIDVAMRDAGLGVLLLGAANLPPALGAGEPAVAVRDEDGAQVGRWRSHGRGRVGVSDNPDAYVLFTAGDAQGYAAHWQALTDTLSRPPGQFAFEVPPAPARVGDVTQVCGHTSAGPLPTTFALSVSTDDVRPLAARAHPARPGQHCAYVWPAHAGWHALTAAAAQLDLFVHGPDAWRDLVRVERRRATALAAQSSVAGDLAGADRARPLPRWWFFLLCVVAAGALWFEQKLFSVTD